MYNAFMHIELQKAIELLKNDQVVAIPTETVYGLAASLFSETAIKKIFQLKNRPVENPLIVHVSNPDDATALMAEKPPQFDALTSRFWPGPLTLVVPSSSLVPEIARAGLPSVGIRVPSHPITKALLSQTGPLVAPSANLSGRPSSTTPVHVENDFGQDFPILDGGPCTQGLESTVLVYKNRHWTLGRYGFIPHEELETLLGYPLKENLSEKPVCPGQRFRHYSPNAKLILSKGPHWGPYVIGFEGRDYPNAKKIFYLGCLSKPDSISQNLYNILRQIDLEEIKEVSVDMNFEPFGVFCTIGERLEKAAVIS